MMMGWLERSKKSKKSECKSDETESNSASELRSSLIWSCKFHLYLLGSANEIYTNFSEEEVTQIDVNPQMNVSEGRLALLRKAGTELVSNVEIAAVAREFERRKEVHEEKKRRMKILADEADANLEKFEAIRRRWTGSLARDVPQELRDALTDQCKACEEVLSAKNQLIGMISILPKATN
jgi:hypothetical protein